MENILKNQFVNLTLIISAFEVDFMGEQSDLTVIHDLLKSYVNWARDIMCDYCFERYDSVNEVFDDELDMLADLNNDLNDYSDTPYYPYINSMRDIIKETMDEVYNKL